MTKEKMFYISYRICDYIRNREMQNQFEDYEFCMYVSDLAKEIEYANYICNYDGLNPYYKALYNELEDLNGMETYIDEVKELIALLNECKE